MTRNELWNKCEVCGRIISYVDLETGRAIHNMKTPDSDVSYETWETLCRDHYQPTSTATQPNHNNVESIHPEPKPQDHE